MIDVLFKKFEEKGNSPNNPKASWTMDRILNHLHCEASEIWDAIRKNKPRQELVEEVSDTLNLVIVVAVRLGISSDELLKTSLAKFDEVAKRETNGITH